MAKKANQSATINVGDITEANGLPTVNHAPPLPSWTEVSPARTEIDLLRDIVLLIEELPAESRRRALWYLGELYPEGRA